MTDDFATEGSATRPGKRLSSTVVNLPDPRMARLVQFSAELKLFFGPLAENIPFVLHVAGSATPRLWLDAVCHVTLDVDQRTWLFRRDRSLETRELYRTRERAKMLAFAKVYMGERLRLAGALSKGE